LESRFRLEWRFNIISRKIDFKMNTKVKNTPIHTYPRDKIWVTNRGLTRTIISVGTVESPDILKEMLRNIPEYIRLVGARNIKSLIK
jgi:hypothetical protein